MGMDLYVLRLLRALTPAEAEADDNARAVYVTPAQAKVLTAKYPDAVFVPIQSVNTGRMLELSGLDSAWVAEDWNLTAADGWMEFEHAVTAERRRMPVASSLVLDSDPDCLVGWFDAPQEHYLRKPFRHYSTPTEIRGNTAILSTDNFAGVEQEQAVALMGPMAREHSVAMFLPVPEDMARLEALGALCHSPALWKEKVLEPMGWTGCVVLISW